MPLLHARMWAESEEQMLPMNVGTGRVTGRFIVGVVDGPDPDLEPDAVAAAGTVTFTASVPYLPNLTAEPAPVTILKTSIIGVLDGDGYLCTPDPTDPLRAGARGVRLIATDDPDLSVQGWTWTVAYSFQPVNGSRPAIGTHSMALPEGSTVDLTSVVKVPSSTGIGIEQAEALAAAAAVSAAEASAAAQAASEAVQATDVGVATLINNGGATAAAGDVRWVVKANRPINALDYLTADGVTDEGQVLHDLIGSLPSGAVIDLPNHRTIFSTRFVTLRRPITVRGGIIRSTASAPALWAISSDVTIEGTKLILNGTDEFDAAVSGIRANGAEGAPLTNVHIRDVTVLGSQATGLKLEWLKASTVDRVTIKDYCYMGIQVSSGYDVAVDRADVSGVVHQVAVGNSYGVSVSDSANTEAARSRHVTVSRSAVDGVRNWCAMETHGGYDIRFVNNTITNSASGIAMVSGDSSRVTSAERATVTGNYIDFGDANLQRGGLRLQGKTGTGGASGVMTGNTVVGFTAPTIFTEYDAAKSIVTGNVTA